MLLQTLELFPGIDVPNLHQLVVARTGDGLPVRRERDCQNGVSVAVNRGQQLGLGLMHVPDLDLTETARWTAGDSEPVSVGGERNGPHQVGMPAERRDPLSIGE